MFFSSNQAKINQLKNNIKQDIEASLVEVRNECLRILSAWYVETSYSYSIPDSVDPNHYHHYHRFLAYYTERLYPYTDLVDYKDSEKDILKKMSEILKKHPLEQPKEYFAWSKVNPFVTDDDSFLQFEDYYGKLEFFFELQYLAQQLDKATEHTEILRLACEIRDYSQVIHSDNGDIRRISVSTSPLSGRTIASNLVLGVYDTIHTTFVLAYGIVGALPAWCLGSPYFGTSSFLLDAALRFTEAVLTVLSAVVFPIALLHSKGTTDSYDVLTGHRLRMIESLIRLCVTERDPDIEEKNTLYDDAYSSLHPVTGVEVA